MPAPRLLSAALLAVAAFSGGFAADVSQVVPDEQDQGSREQAAESRWPQERAGELERRLQRRRAHRDVPAQAQPPARSRTTLPSFDGLGVSLDDADAIVKMRQIRPAQYARSPEAVHTRELAALHEELSNQAGGERAGV